MKPLYWKTSTTKSCLKMIGTRYPKESHPTLPDNYQLSRKRLHRLLHRLRQHPLVLMEYNVTIRDQLSKRIVEVNESQRQSTGVIHCILHHAVIRKNKHTTKLRVVYDTSAKGDGLSLPLYWAKV